MKKLIYTTVTILGFFGTLNGFKNSIFTGNIGCEMGYMLEVTIPLAMIISGLIFLFHDSHDEDSLGIKEKILSLLISILALGIGILPLLGIIFIPFICKIFN